MVGQIGGKRSNPGLKYRYLTMIILTKLVSIVNCLFKLNCHSYIKISCLQFKPGCTFKVVMLMKNIHLLLFPIYLVNVGTIVCYELVFEI